MTVATYIIALVLLLLGAAGVALALQRYRKDRKDKRRHQVIVFAPSVDDRDDR